MKEQRRVYEALSKVRESQREELKSEKVELNMLNDAKGAKSKAESAAKRAAKSINSAISDLRDGAIAVNKGLKIAEEAIEKAKELGADSFIKQGEAIKSEFDSIIKEYTRAIQNLQASRKIVS